MRITLAQRIRQRKQGARRPRFIASAMGDIWPYATIRATMALDEATR
jgi:hypothetical protein